MLHCHCAFPEAMSAQDLDVEMEDVSEPLMQPVEVSNDHMEGDISQEACSAVQPTQGAGFHKMCLILCSRRVTEVFCSFA